MIEIFDLIFYFNNERKEKKMEKIDNFSFFLFNFPFFFFFFLFYRCFESTKELKANSSYLLYFNIFNNVDYIIDVLLDYWFVFLMILFEDSLFFQKDGLLLLKNFEGKLTDLEDNPQKIHLFVNLKSLFDFSTYLKSLFINYLNEHQQS